MLMDKVKLDEPNKQAQLKMRRGDVNQQAQQFFS